MSIYHKNIGIRESIDSILKRNAKRQANLGIDSTEEERVRAEKLWQNDLIEIGKLDKEFAESLHAQDV